MAFSDFFKKKKKQEIEIEDDLTEENKLYNEKPSNIPLSAYKKKIYDEEFKKEAKIETMRYAKEEAKKKAKELYVKKQQSQSSGVMSFLKGTPQQQTQARDILQTGFNFTNQQPVKPQARRKPSTKTKTYYKPVTIKGKKVYKKVTPKRRTTRKQLKKNKSPDDFRNYLMRL